MEPTSELSKFLSPNELEDEDPEAIRASITQTRASMAEKLDTLKHEVENVVESAVTSAKDTVAEVKHELDIRTHIKAHPWTALAVAATAGFLVGNLKKRDLVTSNDSRVHNDVIERASQSTLRSSPAPSKVAEKARGVWNILEDSLGSELNEVKRTVTSNALLTLKNMVKEAAPLLTPNIERVYQKLTDKLVK